MKSIKSIPIAIAISFFGLIACEINNTSDEKHLNESPQTLSEYLGKKVQRNFSGTVTDEDKNPLKSVTVSIGDKTVQTDSKGDFVINEASVNANFVYLEIKKEGYRNNASSLVPSDSFNEVVIVLQEENVLCLHWFCKHNHSLPNSN